MELAASMARILEAGDIVALEGPLGSGKTCFVRGLVRGLGLDQSSVSSPTFVICQEYATPSPASTAEQSRAMTPLVHLDAYRLSGPDDLEGIGWDELLQAADAVIAVEWPSRIESALPEERIAITLAPTGEHSREIRIAGSPRFARQLEKLAAQTQVPITQPAACRTCGRAIETGDPNFPFCSARCKMADLGKWFNEGYRVSRHLEADEELAD